MKKKKAKQPTRKPKKEPARTLLDDFMFDRLDKFVPAVRRGTPKGEVIGFSLKKYSTLFHLMRDWPLKEVAGAAGVSYGVLKRWRTEKEFIRGHRELQAQFAFYLYNYISLVFKKRQDQAPIDFLSDPKFADASTYGKSLRIAIRDVIEKFYLGLKRSERGIDIKICLGPENLDLDSLETIEPGGLVSALVAMHAIEIAFPDEGDMLKREYYKVVCPGLSESILSSLKDFTKKKSPTEKDRSQALKNIQLLDWYLIKGK